MCCILSLTQHVSSSTPMLHCCSAHVAVCSYCSVRENTASPIPEIYSFFSRLNCQLRKKNRPHHRHLLLVCRVRTTDFQVRVSTNRALVGSKVEHCGRACVHARVRACSVTHEASGTCRPACRRARTTDGNCSSTPSSSC